MSTTVETATDIRPFHVDIPDRSSTTCAAASPRRAGPARSSSQIGRRACSWRRCRSSRATGRPTTTGARCEAKLNALPQFTTEIDGVDIHFIHVKSQHENALPLIMTHGWPGSVIELLETVGPLTDPTAHGGTAEDAFDLVLPSMPGYGFSGEPTEVGWDAGRIARAWAELMHRLGYSRYVAQGGDQGAGVTDAMGRQAPEGLLGIHFNLLVRGARVGRLNIAAGTPRRNARRSKQVHDVQRRRLRATSSSRPRSRRRSATPCWIHRSGLAAWMLDHDADSYEKISRAFVDGQPSGNLTRDHDPRQHHAVLADEHRGLGGAAVLGDRTSRKRCHRPGSSAGLAPGGLHRVPRRDLPGPAQLGRAGLPQPELLQQGRQGRPLRRLGGAASYSPERCEPHSGHCADSRTSGRRARRVRAARGSPPKGVPQTPRDCSRWPIALSRLVRTH